MARKSTGPRSEPGKKRAGQNASRHGLTVHVTSVEFERQLKVLARRIAGETDDKMTLEHARVAAEAELELARRRQVKTALIERIIPFGGFEPPKHFPFDLAEVRWLVALDDYIEGRRARRLGPIRPIAVDPWQPCRCRSRIVRRRRHNATGYLHRYESRAVMRRDRAMWARSDFS